MFNQIQNNPNQSLSIDFWSKDELPPGNQLGSMFEFFESMFLRGRSPLNLGINTSTNDATYTIFEDTAFVQNNSIVHFVLVFDEFDNGNAPGCELVATVENECQRTRPVCPQVSTLVLTTQAEVDAFVNQYPNCEVLNCLLIEGSVTDSSGLSNLTTINGFFTVASAPNLTSLNGLQNITQVTERVLILSCTLVTDLTGLIGLQISGSGTSTIALRIVSMNGLTSLNGLENYANANSKRVEIASNINLTDISAIENLDANTLGQLYILGNTQLSVCSNSIVCSKLTSEAPTFQNIIIFSNGSGCATEVEAFSSCQTLSIETFYNSNTRTYPNSFTDSIYVKLPLGVDKASV